MSDYIEGEPVDVLITERGGHTWWYSGHWFYNRAIVQPNGKTAHEVVDKEGEYKSTDYIIRRPLSRDTRLKDLEQWRAEKLKTIDAEYKRRLNKINKGEGDNENH